MIPPVVIPLKDFFFHVKIVLSFCFDLELWMQPEAFLNLEVLYFWSHIALALRGWWEVFLNCFSVVVFCLRPDGWILHSKANGVWSGDSHWSPQLCDCSREKREIYVWINRWILKAFENFLPQSECDHSDKESYFKAIDVIQLLHLNLGIRVGCHCFLQLYFLFS